MTNNKQHRNDAICTQFRDRLCLRPDTNSILKKNDVTTIALRSLRSEDSTAPEPRFEEIARLDPFLRAMLSLRSENDSLRTLHYVAECGRTFEK